MIYPLAVDVRRSIDCLFASMLEEYINNIIPPEKME